MLQPSVPNTQVLEQGYCRRTGVSLVMLPSIMSMPTADGREVQLLPGRLQSFLTASINGFDEPTSNLFG